jgi:hypothetical protein
MTDDRAEPDMLTLKFDDPRSTDNMLVGGKAYGMATMTQADILLSPGFTVTTRAYREYLDATGLRSCLEAILDTSDRDSIEALGGGESAPQSRRSGSDWRAGVTERVLDIRQDVADIGPAQEASTLGELMH